MAVKVKVITQEQYDKVGYGPKKFKRAILNGEATSYSYFQYGGKRTCTGEKIETKHIKKLIAVDKKNIKIGESIEVYSRSTKKRIFKGVAGDYCPSKPKHEGNAVLIDCLLNTSDDCSNFGRRDVVIFIV